MEYWSSVESYYIHLAVEREQKLFEKKRNELIIKYNETIFAVFNGDQYLQKSEIYSRLKSFINNDENKANEIIDLWEEYRLINAHYTNMRNYEDDEHDYEISTVVEYPIFDSEFKITRKEWLEKNNKKLKISKRKS